MAEFAEAAMPWGITGIFLAIVFAHGDGGAKKRRQKGK